MSGIRPYANVVVKDTSGVNQAGRIGLVLEPPQFVLVCYRRGPLRILRGSRRGPVTAQRRLEPGQTLVPGVLIRPRSPTPQTPTAPLQSAYRSPDSLRCLTPITNNTHRFGSFQKNPRKSISGHRTSPNEKGPVPTYRPPDMKHETCSSTSPGWNYTL